MKKEFSKKWNSSRQTRKQRKFRANAPLNIKRKFLGANLSKKLREKYLRRSFVLRKGDVVKIMNGKFKGKTGKVVEVKTLKSKVMIEGIQNTRRDGTKVNVSFEPSNLQIQELNLDDVKRKKAIDRKIEAKEKIKKTEVKMEEKKNAP